MTDSYTAQQAAKVLGISERRVRQLAVERVLNVVSDKPLKLGMESVHVERERRRTGPSEAVGSAAGLLTAQQAVELAERLAHVLSARAIESSDMQLAEQKLASEKVEAALRDALAESQAEAARLRAELDTRSSSMNPVEAVRGLLRWRP